MLQPIGIACCFLISLLAVFEEVQGSEASVANDVAELARLHPAMWWMEDPAGALTLNEVRNRSDEFDEADAAMINPGLSDAIIWVRLPLSNESKQVSTVVISLNRYLVAAAAIYVVHEGGDTATLLANDAESFRDAFRQYGTLAASLTLEPEASAEVYVRYRGANWSGLQLTLHRAEEFFANRWANDAVFFLLLGGVLTLVLYGAISFMFLGVQVVLLYCAGQLAFFAFFAHFSGYTTVYLWPEAPWFGRLFSPASMLAYVLAMTQFARVFFETHARTPWLDRLLVSVLYLGAAAVALAAADMVSDAFQTRAPLLMTYASMAISWILLPGLALYATWKWHTYFWPIAIAWTGVAGFILFMVSMLLGGTALVPAIGKPIVAAAVFFEALFFALGIALRIRTIRIQALGVERRLAASLRSELEAVQKAQRLTEERRWAMSDLAEKGRLLLATGHDTRQILGALRGYASALRRGMSADEAKRLGPELENAAIYLNDVLSTAVAGSQSGGLTDASLAIDTLTVEELLKPLTMVYGHPAAQKGLDIIVRGGDRQVVVDRVLLLRVLGNFLSNAIKYTSKGKVLVAFRECAHQWRFQVFDTGVGLEPAVLARLLDPASGPYRANSEAGEGLGAGMGISHRLALRLGGHINARSSPGSGSMFEVVLPKPGPLDRTVADDWLVFDGDAHLLLRGSPLDWTQSPAAGGPPALAIIDENYRGEGTGIEVAAELKRHGWRLVLTTYDRSAETRTTLMRSADLLIYKPVSEAALAYIARRAPHHL